jgi:hypothetical protein
LVGRLVHVNFSIELIFFFFSERGEKGGLLYTPELRMCF